MSESISGGPGSSDSGGPTSGTSGTVDVPTSGTSGATSTSSGCPTTSEPTTGSDNDTASTTGSGTTTTTGTTGEVDSTGAGSSTGVLPPDLGGPCNGGAIVPDKTYLWAANSTQGTISKIDTMTVTEVGRYIVRPDSAGSPSRTSVSLTGHVAVANRNGGVTKLYSDPNLCLDTNGMPGIQTSTDANFLPWGIEECVAWYTPFNYESQRPVAWGPGVFNEQTCQWEDEELWTSGKSGTGSLDIIILDGDSGTEKVKITVPTGGLDLYEDEFGIYGAAVDPDGNFWGSQLGSSGRLLKVNRADMSYKIYATPPDVGTYGMSVDSGGIVYLCSKNVGRFDPVSETWKTAEVFGSAGCMADSSDGGLLWMADWNGGVIGVNRETLVVEKTWPAAGSYGISIDFEGYVWTVAYGSNVSKIDPDTGQFQVYGGLVGAYTYSDMIGYSLQSSVFPQ